MPNHIKNRITIIGDYNEVKEVYTKYTTHYPATLCKAYDGTIVCKKKDVNEFSVGWFNPKDGTFKTREIEYGIGLPDEWEFELKESFNKFPDFEKIICPPDDPAYRDEPNQEVARNSPNWWLTWNRNNWGTKWNSYECEEESYNVFTFETAWSGVPDLIREISKQNPKIEINYEYADEDTGYNCGSYKFLNGEIIHLSIPVGGSKEGYELAFKLRPHYKEGYVLKGDKYEYESED
ncbi:DUF1281 family ferredoxin-like fold protein [Chryseobacterium indologenes]|uniref:DUF1281 family ferredoxin-like fold protein n=1 Tax=Chryseobacterium indologenes TaxID=253 RepID=UPI001F4B6BFA|nr:hypothetical protein [Chryseobacterium indologenes]